MSEKQNYRYEYIDLPEAIHPVELFDHPELRPFLDAGQLYVERVLVRQGPGPDLLDDLLARFMGEPEGGDRE
jgi:hypothetical protein